MLSIKEMLKHEHQHQALVVIHQYYKDVFKIYRSSTTEYGRRRLALGVLLVILSSLSLIAFPGGMGLEPHWYIAWFVLSIFIWFGFILLLHPLLLTQRVYLERARNEVFTAIKKLNKLNGLSAQEWLPIPIEKPGLTSGLTLVSFIVLLAVGGWSSYSNFESPTVRLVATTVFVLATAILFIVGLKQYQRLSLLHSILEETQDQLFYFKDALFEVGVRSNFTPSVEEKETVYKALQKKKFSLFFICYPLLICLSLGLAYPGSIALSSLTRMPYLYLQGMRFQPMSYAVFFMTVIMAELILTTYVVNLRLNLYSEDQLLHGWLPGQRAQKLGYRLLSPESLLKKERLNRGLIFLGILTLVFDGFMNFEYLYGFLGLGFFSSILVALLIPCIVVGLSIGVAHLKYTLALMVLFEGTGEKDLIAGQRRFGFELEDARSRAS